MSEVIITGLGSIAPNGLGKDNFWNALCEGKSGIRRISRFDPTGYPSQIAGEIPREWIEKLEPFPESGRAWSTHLILIAARMALQDAKISYEEFARSRSGIWVGISTSDMGVVESEYDLFKVNSSTKPTVMPSSFPHAAASELSAEFKCSGQVVTVSTGCPSGIFSIILAAESILNGKTDVALAGGGDAPLTPFVHACFCATGLLPFSYNDEPPSASRPFDAKREGGVLAEGSGMLLLEDAERALARGAKALGRISGWSISNAPSPKHLKSSFTFSIKEALQKAQLSPVEIDYISAHAPGDRFIDKIETQAIKDVFGDYAYNLPISSIKSMIGNPLAASGPLQIIASAQVIANKFIPPTVNYQYPDPHCDLDCVPNKGRVARVGTALVNLSGIGGCNASLVITGT